MKNEIMEELWEIKDQIAHECGYDIDKLANELRTKENKGKTLVVDFSAEAKPVTAKS